MPSVEFVVFPASDALLADESVIFPALDFISKVEGYIKTYWGLQLEDKKTLYWAIVWESYEHHKAFMQSSELHVLISHLKVALGGKPTIQNVVYSDDATNAFTAPTTELVTFKKKDGSTDELKAGLRYIADIVDKLEKTHPPTVFGPTIEDPSVFFAAAGWDSLEAHQEALAAKSLGEKGVAFIATVDASVVHAIFKQYSA
ncbi:hypothetical protein BDQ12DRAFT_711448 [Crucibulum laeve]|uniref:ABM domain-containing protein n=1 Tax=Crucibulum laeve TaxID=68775 RepID=A0A5C3M837_9AGAR|nr:hypothetical protein BDQ12DRAFT_711448 [Crucibulum laeve]